MRGPHCERLDSITSTFTDQTGALIALGAAKLADIAGSTAAAALEPLWQMNQAAFAGEAQVELIDGVAQVTARISQQLAATKVGKRVFRGFDLALLLGADGATRICRIGLVDSPQAVSKAVGAEQVLKLSRRPVVTTQRSSILCDPRQVAITVREARDRKAEAARFAKAGTDLPCGNPDYRQTQPQGQGTSTTAGGRGKDKAPYGQDQGADEAMQSIRRMLAQPFAEAGGLVTLLHSRAA